LCAYGIFNGRERNVTGGATIIRNLLRIEYGQNRAECRTIFSAFLTSSCVPRPEGFSPDRAGRSFQWVTHNEHDVNSVSLWSALSSTSITIVAYTRVLFSSCARRLIDSTTQLLTTFFAFELSFFRSEYPRGRMCKCSRWDYFWTFISGLEWHWCGNCRSIWESYKSTSRLIVSYQTLELHTVDKYVSSR